MLTAIVSASASFMDGSAMIRGAVPTVSRPAVAPIMQVNVFDQMKDAADKAAKEVKGAAAEAIVKEKVAAKLAKAQEKYDIPEQYVNVMGGFFTSYMTEVYKAGNDVDYYEKVLTDLFRTVLERSKEPYKFEPFHKAMREPFDYYALGNDFASGVINAADSPVKGMEQITKIQEQVAAGDNVVLYANHQSEADPQIFSVLLDPIVPGFAEQTIFVAGDRVTTDLRAQPFAMGRNLLCIFSKKHIENPPELKSEKSRHNRNVMKEMGRMFKDGGKIIWVAPSGGRDRKDANGEYEVAPFDSKSIEMFRLMADKAGRTTHFYPLSMLTYNVCPPPEQVGGAVGEQRTVKFSPAALHFGEEVDLEEYQAGCVVDNFPADCVEGPEMREKLRDLLTEHIHSIVQENYSGLTEEMATHEAFKK